MPHDIPPPAPAGRYGLVLNRQAGALLGGAPVDALHGHFARAGITLQEAAGETLPERIEAAASDGEALVVVGGDGTIACACQHLAGRETALAIVAAGTMNMLARDLRLPTGHAADRLEQAAAALIAGRIRRIDLGEVGGHVFACACMLGLPARIGHHRERARARGNGPLGWLRVGRAALRAVRRGGTLRLTLDVDGHEVRVRTPSLSITVNRLDDATGRFYGRSVLDGGELCAYVMRPRGARDLLRLGARLLLRHSARDPMVACHCGREIAVRAADAALRVLIDGEEHLLQAPLRFTVRPGALRVIAPLQDAARNLPGSAGGDRSDDRSMDHP